MVRFLVMVVLAICFFGVNGMLGGRARRSFDTKGVSFGSERGSGGGGGSGSGYFNYGSDKRDSSDSKEDDCIGKNFETRESTYGRDDYNSNERRHGSRPH